MPDPSLAIVTKARGTFFKPLYEAVAGAQPPGWRTLLVWPQAHASEHPEELVTPRADNLDILAVESAQRQRVTPESAKGDRAAARFAQMPARGMWRLLDQHTVRGVLVHEFSPFTLQGLLYGRWRGLPVWVSSEVGRRNAHFFSPRTRWWHALWGWMVQGVVACCPAAHEPLSGRRLPTISAYHAVDSRLYVPTPPPSAGAITFVYLGQMIHRKGLDLLLAAAARLKAEVGDLFHLRLVGGGDIDWVRGLVRQHHLEAQVELTGFLSGGALREALSGADVFVLPTRQDTYAAVVHEAACLGLPLLISHHAGAAEALVRPGENGQVIDPEDTAGFAMAMKSMLSTRTRTAMRAVSRQVGEQHSAHLRGRALWEWMVEQGIMNRQPKALTVPEKR